MIMNPRRAGKPRQRASQFRIPMHVPILLLCFALLGGAPEPVQGGPLPPPVAVASDLRFAFPEIVDAFHADSGKRVEPSYGSSGIFRRQIAMGAPFQLYLSADESYVQALHAQGLTRDAGTLYALGRLALLTPLDSGLALDGNLRGLRAALEGPADLRFAIANPDHAPYGRAAREVLEQAGLWAAVRPHLVLGENVAQAARFALSGSSDGGIVAYSLALAPGIARRSRHVLIPAERHGPLRQRMVLLRTAGPTAEAFYRFLQSPPARAILSRYGFVIPPSG